MHDQSSVITFLFTDIEGSTRLWEEDPERMRPALASHDALVRAAVEGNHGLVVKMTGDGVHAAFDDPVNAVNATLHLQQALSDADATNGVAFRVRCGLHVGVNERRDNDFFGNDVNRAARVMNVAHGGQMLVSQRVATLVSNRLPDGVALRDLGAVRLRDLATPERIYQIVHPQLRDSFPALRSLEATPNNLAQQLTSFIGREYELTEVRTLLGKNRLLTLHGVGGIGKTRLSLQVAADVMDDFPDGVWFVELAPVADERLVAQTVASVLGVKEEAGRAVIEALVKYVKDRQLLLILDNCEHLVQACAQLAKQLLQAGPLMKVLASSREQLRVSGETTYPVPSLSMPDPRNANSVESLTQSEAVRLFVDRAIAAQPTFAINERNAIALTEICNRLDGIPLAIELAAARMRGLSVENIAARLNDRFSLLTRGDVTALPRQQTLRALIDWSYDLLTEPERVTLRRLSVFAGGWTLEAAETVCTEGELDRTDVLDVLTQLVEKSLVVMEPEGGRYRLLDTVRHYAQEKLDESSDADTVRSRHLTVYLTFAEQARPELVGPKQGAWLARVDLEHENILAADAWADHAEEGTELGLRLVSSMRRYWLIRGLLALGHRATLKALARPGAEKRGFGRCQALFDAGQLDFVMGRYADAQASLEESLAIAREIADKRSIAVVLQPLGMAYHGQGQLDIARGHFEEALALAQELGNVREVAAALNALAQLYRDENNMDAAEPLYEKVVVLAREMGDRESTGIGLLNLAMVSINRGSRQRARDMLIEVYSIVDEIGSMRAGTSALEVSAGLGAQCEEWQRAARFYGAADAQTQAMGLRRDPSDEAFLAPLIASARAALGPAFAVGEADGRALSYGEAISEARAWLQTASWLNRGKQDLPRDHPMSIG